MKILVVTGPTASGKTAVAMALADLMPVRLISVDSAMIYRHMNIGTAKPDAAELARYPHALIDQRDPTESYTVSDFVADADAEVTAALAAGEVPVLVGGTMMYLKAFRDGLDDVPKSTPVVRAEVAARAQELGWQALHDELAAIDAQAAKKIHPNNPQRLSRALEVYALTGQPISSFWGKASSASKRHGVDMLEFGVDVSDRSVLHERIEMRLRHMLAAGFVEEVAALRARRDLSVDLPSMRAVGYRQVWQYLDGDVDESGMSDNVLAATRGLARRQYTWLRRWEHIEPLEGSDAETQAAELKRLAFR